MEREQRHLDREREGEGEEHEILREPGGQHEPAQHGQVERVDARGRPVLPVQGQDRHEHQQRPDERVEHELDRRVDAVGPAPHADDEVHRDQHRLPEHVEEEEVEADEDADHPRLEDEHRDPELLRPLLDRAPRRGQREGAQERGEQHEQEADAVHADVVGDAEGRHPARPLLELRVGSATVEGQVEGHGEREDRHRDRERHHAGEIAPPAGHEREPEPAQGRQERDPGQESGGHRASRKPIRTTTPRSIVSA